MKLRGILIIATLAVLFLSVTSCYGKDNSFNSGQDILKQIEPYFLGTPLFLSKNERLKDDVEKKLRTAIDFVTRASQESPDDPKILFVLGKAYSFAHDLDVNGAWQKSVDALTRVIDLDPGNYQAHLYLAKNYMDAKRFDDAYQLYRAAHTINPKGESQKFMAFALMYQNKISEAIAAMKKYLLSHPEDESAKNILQALEEKRFSLEVKNIEVPVPKVPGSEG